MKHRAYIYAAPVVLAVIAVSVWAYTRPAPIPDREMRASVPYWKGRIASVGPARAYAEFARALSDTGPDEQHGDAHVFGSALYAAQGVAGMQTCDSRFSYGCYHELVGEAIAGHGLSIVSDLQDSCGGMTGCEHGIGHGLVGALGYTRDALKRAITVCQDVVPGPIDGCGGGAFMEYNMRTLASAARSTSSTRPIDASGLLAPCMWFTGSARESCALLQPQWWNTVLLARDHLDGTALFSRMGALCAQFAETAAIRACFEGAGWIAAAHAHYDPADTSALCDATSPDARARLYCRSLAAQLFPSVGLSAVEGAKVCDDLAPAAQAYCVAYADGEANLSHPIPDRADEPQ